MGNTESLESSELIDQEIDDEIEHDDETTHEQEIYCIKANELVDSDLIRRVDKTAYLLRGGYIQRYQRQWFALTDFTLSKRKFTDDWKIIITGFHGGNVVINM